MRVNPIWLIILAVLIVTLVLAAALYHFLGMPFIVSIAAILIVFVVVYVILMWLSDRKRMNYSPDGDVALKQIVAGLKSQVLAQIHGILEVEGVWCYGYPKLTVLFQSNEALEQAQGSGLLDQLGNNVANMVKSEPAFGPNRKFFDPKQAVWAMTDRQIWDVVVRNIH